MFRDRLPCVIFLSAITIFGRVRFKRYDYLIININCKTKRVRGCCFLIKKKKVGNIYGGRGGGRGGAKCISGRRVVSGQTNAQKQFRAVKVPVFLAIFNIATERSRKIILSIFCRANSVLFHLSSEILRGKRELIKL